MRHRDLAKYRACSHTQVSSRFFRNATLSWLPDLRQAVGAVVNRGAPITRAEDQRSLSLAYFRSIRWEGWLLSCGSLGPPAGFA